MKGDKGLLRHAPDTATGYRVTNETYVEWFTGSKDLGWRLLSSTVPSIDMVDTSKPVIDIKKPRTKTEFVKVESDLAWELVKDFEEGVEFYTCSKGLHTSKNIGNLLSVWCGGDLHRKVEIEIDERQEFIDTAVELLNQNSHDQEANHYKEWFGAMFDSGKFKLVG